MLHGEIRQFGLGLGDLGVGVGENSVGRFERGVAFSDDIRGVTLGDGDDLRRVTARVGIDDICFTARVSEQLDTFRLGLIEQHLDAGNETREFGFRASDQGLNLTVLLRSVDMRLRAFCDCLIQSADLFQGFGHILHRFQLLHELQKRVRGC